MQTAFGFRAHSGWAALVAVAGTLDAPMVIDRRRIVIADPSMAGSKQPYHAAAELPLAEAEALVRKAIESSRALACEAVAAAVKDLHARGHQVAACSVLRGSRKALPAIQTILASHALIHTAEGELFRDVLADAGRECRLRVENLREKDIPHTLRQRVDPLGKRLGPPWTQDQKYAAVAALLALQSC